MYIFVTKPSFIWHVKISCLRAKQINNKNHRPNLYNGISHGMDKTWLHSQQQLKHGKERLSHSVVARPRELVHHWSPDFSFGSKKKREGQKKKKKKGQIYRSTGYRSTSKLDTTMLLDNNKLMIFLSQILDKFSFKLSESNPPSHTHTHTHTSTHARTQTHKWTKFSHVTI